MIGRFAPSPSGRMHLGNIWTALLNYLEVRRQQGTIILRIEDIDQARCSQEYEQQLLADLDWLGLDYDQVMRQSDRIDIYESFFNKLDKQELIYPCFCKRADIKAASAPHRDDGHRLYQGRCRYPDTEQLKDRRQQTPSSWPLNRS